MSASENNKEANDNVAPMINILKNIKNQKLTLKEMINEYYNGITIQMISKCNQQLQDKHDETLRAIEEIKKRINE